jgi:hypothetical protein
MPDMANRSIRTLQTRKKFLALLGEIGNVTYAAAGCGIARSSFYLWRDEDPSFAHDWDRAVQMGIDALEDIARQRASASSDLLLIFLLKAHRPERYRDRASLEISQNLTVQDFRRLPREELLRRLEALRREQADLSAQADLLAIEADNVIDLDSQR